MPGDIRDHPCDLVVSLDGAAHIKPLDGHTRDHTVQDEALHGRWPQLRLAIQPEPAEAGLAGTGHISRLKDAAARVHDRIATRVRAAQLTKIDKQKKSRQLLLRIADHHQFIGKPCKPVLKQHLLFGAQLLGDECRDGVDIPLGRRIAINGIGFHHVHENARRTSETRQKRKGSKCLLRRHGGIRYEARGVVGFGTADQCLMPGRITPSQVGADGIAHKIVRKQTAVGHAHEGQPLKPIVEGVGILARQQCAQQWRRKRLNNRGCLECPSLHVVQRFLDEIEHQVLQFTLSALQTEGLGAQAFANIRGKSQYERVSLRNLPERLLGSVFHTAPNKIGARFVAVEIRQFKDLHQIDPAEIGAPSRTRRLPPCKNQADG